MPSKRVITTSRKKSLLVLLLAALILWTLTTTITVYAQEPQPTATPTASETDAEVMALRAQLEQMQRYDDRLLQTVWGTLALVGAVALFLVGYNGFVSNRNYERDKAAMQQEL